MAATIRTADQRLSHSADGYVTDIAYTRHHHATLDPGRAILVAERAGRSRPAIQYACELGFGQGLSLAIHSSASDTEWWGVDVLPQHVEFARSLIDDPRARERVVCANFEQFDSRDDLPCFDFIALHGVWSWVSAQNRARIAAFIDRRLAPNGIVYLGYNALPGWGPVLSLRELLVATASQANSARLEDRIEAALRFAARVVASNPRILDSQPAFERQLREIHSKKKSYLAHEYFNRDWHPMHFAQVAAELVPLGLSYLGQADFSDSYDQWRLTEGQRELLATVDDPLLRETARDVILDRRFRRDYWVRSEAAPASASYSRLETRLWIPPALRSVDTTTPAEVTKWLASLGAPGSMVTRSIETTAEHAALGYALGQGLVELAREPTETQANKAAVAKINRRILDRVPEDGEMSVLASHLSGSGVELGWWTLALLAAMRVDEYVDAVIHRVLAQAEQLGIALSRQGFALTPEETGNELRARHAALLAQRNVINGSFAI